MQCIRKIPILVMLFARQQGRDLNADRPGRQEEFMHLLKVHTVWSYRQVVRGRQTAGSGMGIRSEGTKEMCLLGTEEQWGRKCQVDGLWAGHGHNRRPEGYGLGPGQMGGAGLKGNQEGGVMGLSTAWSFADWTLSWLLGQSSHRV